VLRPGADLAKSQSPNQLGQTTLLISDAKALLYKGTEITKPKANHTMLGKIGTSLNNSSELLLLRLAEATRRTCALLTIEPFRPLGIEAMNPVPQRLTIHPARLCRLGSLGTFENQR